jgi:hypothetical protein
MKMKRILLCALITFIGIGLKAQNSFPEPNSIGSNVIVDGGYINLIKPEVSTSWARGLFNINPDGTRLSAVGLYGTGENPVRLFLAHGTSPWSSKLGLYIKTDGKVGIGTYSPTQKA